MSIMTVEGFVEDGRIHLKTRLQLPEKTRVYVLVPDMKVEEHGHIFSPRLVNYQQGIDFKMQVIEEPSNAFL